VPADDTWTKVPVGLQADRWRTVQPARTVLVIVHTVTAVTRLLDVLPAFDSDLRVQLVFTSPEVSAVRAGVREVLAELGAPTIGWAQALQTEFDLAIAAAHSGSLYEINAPLVLLSHGIGYTKNSPGSRVPGPGSRAPRATYGLSPQWLLHDGQPFAAAIGLSHDEQLKRLSDAVPQAVQQAEIVGDPCYDRIAASVRYRDRYRKALGVRPDQRLVVVSSTWWSHSLFGTWPDLFRQLMAALPLDDHRVAGVVHPHVWYGHGGFQMHSWLADCQRAGLILVPPLEGWRAALVAADCVIGDHGAVTTYATALDKPILLAAFPEQDVAPDSPVELLGQLAPRLRPTEPLDAQIDRVVGEFQSGQWKNIGELITSAPGESLVRLRTLFYRLMRLPEPDQQAPLHILPASFPGMHARPPVNATFVSGSVQGDEVRLTRRPADVYSGQPVAGPPAEAHLSCHAEHPVRALVGNADIVFRRTGDIPGTVEEILGDILADHPGCFMAVLTDDDGCWVRTRESNSVVRLPAPAGLPPEAAASALLIAGKPAAVVSSYDNS
jgi:hypothetical protein